ncbi:hypothetical protein M406DRAFT_74953, partial [Cryphonectria parasitica EP155]
MASTAKSVGQIKRVKTGCITCRIRRVKCGEEKPHCRRCVSTGRKCDGYTPIPTSRGQLIIALREQNNARGSGTPSLTLTVSPISFLSSNEASQFDYFRMRTAVKTNTFLGADFWSLSVLQLSYVEPSMKYAVLALSALHRRTESRDRATEAEAWHLKGLVHYGNAVNAAQKLLQRAQASISSSEGTKALATCLVLSVFDNLTGNYKCARMHLQSGLRLADERSAQPRHTAPTMEATYGEVTHLLERLDLQAMAFSDFAAPYPYQDGAARHNINVPLPEAFSNISDARQHLIRILRLFQPGGPTSTMTIRCRDPAVRRRAIALMRATHRVEGCWESYGAAAVAQRVMEVEEGFLGPDAVITCAADIPQEARCHSIITGVRMVERQVDMQLVKILDGSWYRVRET